MTFTHAQQNLIADACRQYAAKHFRRAALVALRGADVASPEIAACVNEAHSALEIVTACNERDIARRLRSVD